MSQSNELLKVVVRDLLSSVRVDVLHLGVHLMVAELDTASSVEAAELVEVEVAISISIVLIEEVSEVVVHALVVSAVVHMAGCDVVRGSHRFVMVSGGGVLTVVSGVGGPHWLVVVGGVGGPHWLVVVSGGAVVS